MPPSPLTAISAIDGRYSEKTRALVDYCSEYGLIRHRIEVEIHWLKLLAATAEIPEIPPLTKAAGEFLDRLVADFDVEQAGQVKAIEAKINHDVKAVEEYLRGKLKQRDDLRGYSPFIHIACTSEDVNSTAYALMIKNTLERVLLPAFARLEDVLCRLACEHADLPLLSLTHGQPASPTTLGKEFANLCSRLHTHRTGIEAVPIAAKWNGAVGNYNTHDCAWPQIDWPAMSTKMLASLGLQTTLYTTQIEPHDHLAALLDALARASRMLIDLCRDSWGYIARGILVQKLKKHEVGSSTMPHKVNPIDFENAEGNLGLAAALAGHLSHKLLVSRWQRDLSDSTAMRSIGGVFAHLVISLDSISKGCAKVSPAPRHTAAELARHPQVLTEAIQTLLRKHGVEDAYDRLKELARGEDLSLEQMRKFTATLPLPEAEKEKLLALTAESYTGLAADLARTVKRRLK